MGLELIDPRLGGSVSTDALPTDASTTTRTHAHGVSAKRPTRGESGHHAAGLRPCFFGVPDGSAASGARPRPREEQQQHRPAQRARVNHDRHSAHGAPRGSAHWWAGQPATPCEVARASTRSHHHFRHALAALACASASLPPRPAKSARKKVLAFSRARTHEKSGTGAAMPIGAVDGLRGV